MEVSGQLHALTALPPGKSPQCPLDGSVDGPQSRSGRYGEEKNHLPLPGIEPWSSSPYVARRYTNCAADFNWLPV
jgi:hypothetical protein